MTKTAKALIPDLLLVYIQTHYQSSRLQLDIFVQILLRISPERSNEKVLFEEPFLKFILAFTSLQIYK